MRHPEIDSNTPLNSFLDPRNGGTERLLQGNVTESIILDAGHSDLLVHVRVFQVHHRAAGTGGVDPAERKLVVAAQCEGRVWNCARVSIIEPSDGTTHHNNNNDWRRTADKHLGWPGAPRDVREAARVAGNEWRWHVRSAAVQHDTPAAEHGGQWGHDADAEQLG